MLCRTTNKKVKVEIYRKIILIIPKLCRTNPSKKYSLDQLLMSLTSCAVPLVFQQYHSLCMPDLDHGIVHRVGAAL